MVDYFAFTSLFKNINKNEGSFNWVSPKVKVMLKIILCYSLIKQNQTLPETFVLMLLLVLIHFGLLAKLILDKLQKYDESIEIMHYLSWIFVMCYYLVEILKLYIDLVKDNAFLVLFSFFTWSFFAYYKIMTSSKSNLLFKSPD